MNYKNMAANAPYRLSHLNHETYAAIATEVSPWSSIPGWRLENNVFDFMHNCFLGTGKDFVASAIRLLLERGAFDGFHCERSSDLMFARITMEIQDTYKQHGFLSIKVQYEEFCSFTFNMGTFNFYFGLVCSPPKGKFHIWNILWSNQVVVWRAVHCEALLLPQEQRQCRTWFYFQGCPC